MSLSFVFTFSYDLLKILVIPVDYDGIDYNLATVFNLRLFCS